MSELQKEPRLRFQHRVPIADDFDLLKIIDSGQNFRAFQEEDGTAFFITGKECLWIRPAEAHGGEAQLFDVSVDPATWEKIWVPYFDLEHPVRPVREKALRQGGYLARAADFGTGIRILRQDPWEMLITFILSQRKSIPAIRTAVRQLSETLGERVSVAAHSVFLFPTPDRLAALDEPSLRALGLGYRAPYVQAAAQAVASGALDLNTLAEANDAVLLEALLATKGVGIKVANCVMLYGYGRMSSAPVDVWIQRAIDTHFSGENIFLEYGSDAGLLQQYVFYAMRRMSDGKGDTK